MGGALYMFIGGAYKGKKSLDRLIGLNAITVAVFSWVIIWIIVEI